MCFRWGATIGRSATSNYEQAKRLENGLTISFDRILSRIATMSYAGVANLLHTMCHTVGIFRNNVTWWLSCMQGANYCLANGSCWLDGVYLIFSWSWHFTSVKGQHFLSWSMIWNSKVMYCKFFWYLLLGGQLLVTKCFFWCFMTKC